MGIQIDGSANTISGLAVGGLPNGSISSDDIASNAVTVAKLASTLDLSSNTVTLPNTSVTAGMLASTLDISGKTVTLPNTSVTAGMLASTLDLSSKTVTLPSGTGGKVLQVVQASKTDTTSTISQDSFVDLGLSASITPASASNKVLVMVSIGRVTCNTTSNRTCPFRIQRDTTQAGIGDVAGNRMRANFVISDSYPATDNGFGGAYQYLDSPSTTSATTYKIQWSGQAGETWYLNRSGSDTDNGDTVYTRTACHLILMEVQG